MPNKEDIVKNLLETRDSRLLLEIGSWTHDLDKATWMFAAYESELKKDEAEYYSHNIQPHRSMKSKKWSWDNWITDLYENEPSSQKSDVKKRVANLALAKLLPDKNVVVAFRFKDEKGKLYSHDIRARGSGHNSGDVQSLFQYHSAWKTDQQPWEPWLIRSPFGGADGIDSDFFKGGAYEQESGENQNQIPPMVSTPFGLERPVLGTDNDPRTFKEENEKAFRRLWRIAFEGEADGVPEKELWMTMKQALRPYLNLSLGYTARPTNDVNLWAHSYGVGAMAKALAAALALDSSAAASAGKKLLFPLRSPELNLPDSVVSEMDTYLLSPSVHSGDRNALVRQVQVKFKVLSILLRDTERLHVGRRVGDILGYHKRRDDLFEQIARILERELAVGAEIFRDHAGIHFLLPWCQDSLDAGSTDSEPAAGSADGLRSQEALEEMVREVVDVVFRGNPFPQWMKETGITVRPLVANQDPDFDLVVHLGPNREPILAQLEADQDKAVSQGLLFLKDRTSINKDLDKEHPRPFPRSRNQDDKQASVQLCPICRKRPAAPGLAGLNENDRPCSVCEGRRQGRANDWWKAACQDPSIAATTIWTAEASDDARRLNLLTLAFDLSGWFSGRAFDGFWMKNRSKNGEPVLEHLPVYPAPARIRGVWEASMAFLTEVKEWVKGIVESRSRPVYRVPEAMLNPNIRIDPEQGRVLEGMEPSGTDPGEWFLGRDKGNSLWLVGLSGEGGKKIEGKELLARLGFVAQDGRQIHVFKQEALASVLDPVSDRFPYVAMVEVLTDSPTRFQVLTPGSLTVSILQTVHRLFMEHFGKVAHLLPFCASCFTFKEKFPFYLALEAADRAVARELERGSKQARRGLLDPEGLHVGLGDGDPATGFLGKDYQWTCLGHGQRDPWRSLVPEPEVGEIQTLGIFVGWMDPKRPDSLTRMRRVRFFPKMKGLKPDTEAPIFEPKPLTDTTLKDHSFRVCCPRLSWAHLASPGERHREKLSIPLLSLEDWLGAYEVLARGMSRPCEGCWEMLKGQTAAPMRTKAPRVRSLGSRRTQFRTLMEEILDVHARWALGVPVEERQTLQTHIRSLFCHPNACGAGWRQYADATNHGADCPLTLEIDGFLRDNTLGPEMKKRLNGIRKACISQASAFQRSLRRMEALACAQKGEALSVTFDLLAKVCGYEIHDPESTQTGGE